MPAHPDILRARLAGAMALISRGTALVAFHFHRFGSGPGFTTAMFTHNYFLNYASTPPDIYTVLAI